MQGLKRKKREWKRRKGMNHIMTKECEMEKKIWKEMWAAKWPKVEWKPIVYKCCFHNVLPQMVVTWSRRTIQIQRAHVETRDILTHQNCQAKMKNKIVQMKRTKFSSQVQIEYKNISLLNLWREKGLSKSIVNPWYMHWYCFDSIVMLWISQKLYDWTILNPCIVMCKRTLIYLLSMKKKINNINQIRQLWSWLVWVW